MPMSNANDKPISNRALAARLVVFAAAMFAFGFVVLPPLYEAFYGDEAARSAHRETPHFAAWAKFTKHGLDRETIRHATTNFHPTDAEWR